MAFTPRAAKRCWPSQLSSTQPSAMDPPPAADGTAPRVRREAKPTSDVSAEREKGESVTIPMFSLLWPLLP